MKSFPVVRTPEAKRKFKSPAVEKTIERIKATCGNQEIAWMFENCFPNTLDTTVDFTMVNGRPDTYVITGDIDAMWLRDSTAQVWPYLPLMKEDPQLQLLIAGVINRQTHCINYDPYANAFYKDHAQVSEWKDDFTEMKPGIHERKWEVDSLCYPIRLAFNYWKHTGDTKPFDADWKKSIALIVQTFREQQRKNGNGPYRFLRGVKDKSKVPADAGYGNPAKAVGLIFSRFRPSDDETHFQLLIPSNYFAVVSLREAAEMVEKIQGDKALAKQCTDLADEVQAGLDKFAFVNYKKYGRIFAYEVDGNGNFTCVDDANVPCLLALPYLNAVKVDDETYQRSRKFILSTDNLYYFKGKAGEGLGGPHSGMDMIWPMGIVMQGITSINDAEITHCIKSLQKTHAGTGFMHESFHKDDSKNFTRHWFAWANTLFGEFILKVANERPHLLK